MLALAFTANPDLTASEATSLLYSTVTDIGSSGWDQETGYGEVNAYGAVTKTSEYVSGGTTLQVGKTVAFATPGLGRWSWNSSNTGVATVSGGVVTGVSRGTARISALLSVPSIGRLARYQDVTVYGPAVSGASSVPVGSSVTLFIPSTPSGSWKWTSSDTSVATVSSSGTSVAVVGQKPGKATVRVVLSSNADVYSEKDINVTAADLSSATVTFSGAYTYNGNVQKPTPTVKVGTITLAAVTDYTVTYPTDCTNAGKKPVTIKPGASGRVTGTKSASYTIGKKAATITANSKSKTYDGTALTASSVGYSTSGFVKSSDLVNVTLSGSITNAGKTTAKVASFTLNGDKTYSNPGSTVDAKNYKVTVSSGTLTVSEAARQALYHMYNPNAFANNHHYTTSKQERDWLLGLGWRDEGIAWYGV